MLHHLSLIRENLLVWLSLGLLALPAATTAQEQLLGERWLEVRSENFNFYSQLSARQTFRIASEFEVWRQLAAFTIAAVDNFPKAPVPNTVYLFADAEALQAIASTNNPVLFSSTPRANFMALAANDEASISLGFHHYVHFLLRNFSDLRLPRWYEEGLATYIARMRVDGSDGSDESKVEFDRFQREGNETLAGLSQSLSMERLLYNDAALASPRMIQIANLKSSALLHYLLHAYEEENFIDRRKQLQDYLARLLEGRNPRYAYDRSFDVTTSQLDEEFHYYLLNSQRPLGTIQTGVIAEADSLSSELIEGANLALVLAELALNLGEFEIAQRLFQAAIDADQQAARGLSGLGDALRMQDIEGMGQTIARYFIDAAELAPLDVNILLDQGEYWEAELLECEKAWPTGQRDLIMAQLYKFFARALQLAPQNPEANLAMGQYFLLDGDWQQGLAYQQKAFELLPADAFITEQAVKYAIYAEQYEEAERLINELAQPIHYYGEAGWVTELRQRLLKKRRGEPYSQCD